MKGLMIVGVAEIHTNALYYVLMKNALGNHKQCKTFIKHQRVYVNDLMINDPFYQVSQNDKIMFDNQIINSQPNICIMLNKPKGYVCANTDKFYPCIIDIIKRDDCYCLGRLDKDTTGLLILTNIASLSKKLLMPQNHISKKYLVTTKYSIDKNLVSLFKNGVIIDNNYCCQSAIMEIIDEFHCYVTLYEGKYHQIKKMFLSCCNEVIELKRVAFGELLLDENLKEGEYRFLNEDEFQKLK